MEPKAFAMPLDHGCRLDQHHDVQGLRPNPVKPHPEKTVGAESLGRPGCWRRRTVTWCRRATSSSSSEARPRKRKEIRETSAERMIIMPMTVWRRYANRYAF